MALDQFVTLRERGEWFEGRMNDFESGPRCHARGKWWNSADESKISLGILDQHRRFSFSVLVPGRGPETSTALENVCAIAVAAVKR
jgi:hypothetical protein